MLVISRERDESVEFRIPPYCLMAVAMDIMGLIKLPKEEVKPKKEVASKQTTKKKTRKKKFVKTLPSWEVVKAAFDKLNPQQQVTVMTYDVRIEVIIVDIRGDKARLGFEAHELITVHRYEVWCTIEAAAKKDGADNGE